MDFIVETRNLTKVWQKRTAVDRVNLHVKKGEIYGFVGPNGAGKSTVMKLLMNLIPPDGGEACLFGERMGDKSFESFKRTGSIIEAPCFYERMTGRQNLELYCEYMGYHNRERIEEVLSEVGLGNIENKAVSHFSLGMKQRLAIARAILARPELLILDEPVNALDPEGIRDMRRLFVRLNRENGTTIFISSHLLSEVEQIADRIGVIAGGKLLKEISMEEIHAYRTEYVELLVDDVAKTSRLLEQDGRFPEFSVTDERTVRVYGGENFPEGNGMPEKAGKPEKDGSVEKELAGLLVGNGVGLYGLARRKNSLEDYFFQMTENGQEKEREENGYGK